AARTDALGQRPLRIELHFELTGQVLPLELLVLADIARDHLPHLLALQKDPQTLIGGSAVVRDDGEALHALLVDGGDEVFRVAAEAEAPGHDHRAILKVANRLVGARDNFIHQSRSTISAMPSPPPMQSEASPRFLPRSFIA